MTSLIRNEIGMLLWYILRLKDVYDQGGKKVIEYFKDFRADTEEYEIYCLDNLEHLSECTHHGYIHEEYEDSDEQGDVCGEKWVFEDADMTAYYQLLEDLKNRKLITTHEYYYHHNKMEQNIMRLIVNRQYNDGGFHCHLNDGTIPGERCRMEIYRYCDGSFDAFTALCGIITVFEKYREELKCLEEEYTVKDEEETEDKNGA